MNSVITSKPTNKVRTFYLEITINNKLNRQRFGSLVYVLFFIFIRTLVPLDQRLAETKSGILDFITFTCSDILKRGSSVQSRFIARRFLIRYLSQEESSLTRPQWFLITYKMLMKEARDMRAQSAHHLRQPCRTSLPSLSTPRVTYTTGDESKIIILAF